MSEETTNRIPGPGLGETIRGAVAAVESLSALEGRFEDAVSAVVGALAGGNKVLTAGNGGSAAGAMHMAEELSGRYSAERRALPGMALCADGTALTCIGNDYGFDSVFSRQVEAFCRPGDVLALFTTSGRSANLVRAADAARALGAKVIGFVGHGGGDLAAHCDILLDVAGAASPRVQECHEMLMHAILERVDAAFKAQGGAR
ncbi:MAG: SIS domain-containing protein [Kiritimatiellae bacterium]|nr:SIS domain-containing protein [Kiritimatiellia bacterium]